MSRVLVVDDKEENRSYLEALLQGHGYAVEIARHGAEALVKARQTRPDLIISDLLMPVMDGYMLLRHWKADAALKLVPFIVYTATYTEAEDEQLAISLGADAFILKPAEPEDFLARVRDVLAGVRVTPSQPPNRQQGSEQDLLKHYSETLIRKLEEKTLQLEETNRALQQDIRERGQAEATLRLLNSAVLQTHEAVLITDAELHAPGPRIIFVNPAFTEMTGYSQEEVLGKTPRILQGPRTDREVIARLRRNLERGEIFMGEGVNYRKDGSEYIQEWQITPLRETDGTITHFVAVQRDITERKRQESEAARMASTQVALVQIQQEIAAAGLNEEALMDLLAERARELTNAAGGVIEIIDGADMVYRGVSVGIASASRGFRLPRDGSLSGVAVDTGEPQVCTDAETDDRVDRAACRKVGVRSMVIAPLRTDGAIFGVLKVFSDRADAFSRSDVHSLQILAESLGVVVQRHRAIAQLRNSEAQYRLLFSQNPQPMWAYDVETRRFLAVNLAAVREYGWSEAEFLTMTIRDIRPEEDLPRLERQLAELRPGLKTFGLWRHRKKDATLIDVEMSSEGVTFNGRPARLALAHDVTKRLRTERALNMLSACNEALIRTEDELELLRETCRVSVEIGGYGMAWVGYARHDDVKTIEPMAHAGAEDGYLKELRFSWREDREKGQGPAGRACWNGEVALCEDTATDPHFAPWREAALRRGYRSVIAFPLRAGGQTLGVLVLYTMESRVRQDEEIKLLQEMADDLAFGIGNIRARLESRQLQSAVLEIAQGVTLGGGSEFFDLLTESLVQALDADCGMIGRIVGGESPRIESISLIVDRKKAADVSYSLADTPCEQVVREGGCLIERGARELYPDVNVLEGLGVDAYAGLPLCDSDGVVMGLLVVMFHKPIERTGLVQSALQIFATRASAELERQQVEAKLREQAELLDKARDAIIVRDLEHRVLYWNKSAEHLYGWTEEEMRGRPVTEVLYSETAGFARAMDELLRTGEWAGELSQVTRDGRDLIADSRWSLVRDDAGQPKSILVINTDFTERKRSEEALMLAAKRVELAAKASGVGIWELDVRTGLIRADAQMFSLYGEPADAEVEDIGYWLRHIHPEDREKIERMVQAALPVGGPPYDAAFRVIWPADGSIHHIHGQSIVLRDPAGEPIRMIGTNWDVTEQVEREEMLRQKLENERHLREQALAGEKAKSEFLAVMSHEIRTPMNGILGFAEMLANSQSLSPEDRELTDTIVSSGEALLRILDDVLDFSSIEAGKLSIEKRVFPLRELIRNLQSLFTWQIRAKGLQFEVSVDAHLPEFIDGDGGRIRQVLVNLLGNALKFTEQGAIELRVNLAAGDDGGRFVEFVVKDSGMGIAPARLQAVFEPFTQSDSSISRRHGGTGLGLTISRRLAELMDGQLTVRSRPGEGTCFTLRVPFLPADSLIAKDSPDRAATPSLDSKFAHHQPLRILVVEDDKVNRKLIVSILRQLGYEALEAVNGRQAVTIYDEQRPDCVLMDMQMPEMDGIEATQKIRDLEHVHSLPPAYVSALTANILPQDRERCLAVGMNNYLNKPLKRQALADVLVDAVRFRRSLPGTDEGTRDPSLK